MTIRSSSPSRTAPDTDDGWHDIPPAPPKEGSLALVLVWRGKTGADGAALRASIMSVVMRAVTEIRGGIVRTDGNVMAAILPTDEGDAEVAFDKVFRRLYLDDCRTEAQERAKASKLAEIAHEAGVEDAVGLGVIRRYMVDMALTETSACIYILEDGQ